jgi:hypothetical protein
MTKPINHYKLDASILQSVTVGNICSIIEGALNNEYDPYELETVCRYILEKREESLIKYKTQSPNKGKNRTTIDNKTMFITLAEIREVDENGK